VKRVLVTGASGFIGRRTITRLLEAGFDVHASSREVQHLNGVHWHRCDLLEPASAGRLVQDVDPTHLLHLAWYARPGTYWVAPENVEWVEATLRLLRAFARPDRRAVIAGTCAEYDWSFGLCSEGVTPLRPNTLYGECKRAVAAIAEQFAAGAGVSLACGRIFFVYGPGEDPNRLVASVIRSLLRLERAATTEGSQLRDFLHVDDVAAAFVALVKSDVTGPVNVASGTPVSVRELLLTAGRIIGSPELIDFGGVPMRPNEPPLIVADVRRLFDEVKWRPNHTLDSGLADAVSWWRAHIAGERE
jgi:nucleoside-diphosphate-sugar epimerase